MKLLRHIAPFLFIPILLISTIGFSIEIHFCGDEVKSMGLYSTEPCQMENSVLSVEEWEKLPPCHKKKYLADQENKQKDGYNQDNCCHNEHVQLTSEDAAKQANVDLSDINQIQAVLVYAALYFQLFTAETTTEAYPDYRPPLLRQDITVLQQVFRI